MARSAFSPCCTAPGRCCSTSGRPVGFDIAQWAERVQLVDASYAGIWELPIGEVTAPSALLVRPDGHVAWVGEGTDAGLRDALTTWFGPGGLGCDDGDQRTKAAAAWPCPDYGVIGDWRSVS